MTITMVISLITDVGGADRRESLSESKSMELNKYYFDKRPTWRARSSVIRSRGCRLLRNHEKELCAAVVSRLDECSVEELLETLGSNLDADDRTGGTIIIKVFASPEESPGWSHNEGAAKWTR